MLGPVGADTRGHGRDLELGPMPWLPWRYRLLARLTAGLWRRYAPVRRLSGPEGAMATPERAIQCSACHQRVDLRCPHCGAWFDETLRVDTSKLGMIGDMMSDRQVFNLARVFAVGIGLVSTMITFGANAPDLGWTKQQVAYAMMVNQGLSYVLLVLPQVQKRAGNIRGDSTDNA